jgi:hypothetical protein
MCNRECQCSVKAWAKERLKCRELTIGYSEHKNSVSYEEEL